MAWTTPTVTHTRGRFIQHTYVTMVGTMDDQNAVVSAAISLPAGIFAGSIMAISENGTATQTSTLQVHLRSREGWFISQSEVLTLASDPDYFKVQSVFENWTDINTYENKQLVAPHYTNVDYSQWRLSIQSNEVTNSDETVTVYLGLLSHVLEV